MRRIADTLGVVNVLEGSVRRSGNRVRITVQLVTARDGSHVWSERYDREMTDVFAVQDEIAEAVAAALQVTLMPAAVEIVAAGHQPLDLQPRLLDLRRVGSAGGPLGGGFGGLLAAKALNKTPTEVTLIDRRNFHLFQPLLYQVATGGLSPANIAAPLRSILKKQRNTRVLLGDSMGEMYAYYAACDVAFIGGSLLPLGGQNLLEACAVGKPVLIGPHTFNFAEACAAAIAAGAALRVDTARDLAREVVALSSDAQRRERMGSAGRELMQSHRGATQRTLELLERVLTAQG